VIVTSEAFDRLVRDGIARIPEQFRRYLRDTAVVVKREPSPRKKRDAGVPPESELLGLYEGTPRTERAYLPYRLPDKITIFQGPMERTSGEDPERIREEVAHTVWHELAHALGMGEHRVRRAERKRRSRKCE